MAQNELWEFEHPITVTATLPTNITWRPTTFGSEDHGNFTLNLWLLRTDSTSDQVVSDYLPALLFENSSVFNNNLVWIPSVNDIDVGVLHDGVHQMAWEMTSENPTISPTNNSFRGFSTGFQVIADPGSPIPSSLLSLSPTSATKSVSTTTSTSAIGTNPSSTPSDQSGNSASSSGTAISSNAPAKSPSTTGPGNALATNENTVVTKSSISNTTVIGLAVGFSILFVILITIAAVWAGRYYRKRKLKMVPETPETPRYSKRNTIPPLPPQKAPAEMDAGFMGSEMAAESWVPRNPRI